LSIKEKVMTEIERLIVIKDIRELMARYVRYADREQFDGLAGLFTPTGTFTPQRGEGSEWMHMAGRAAIAKTVREGGGGVVAIHHLFSYETEIPSPTTATGSVAEAVELLREVDADALLCDWNLGTDCGDPVVAIARDERPTVVRILMTAASSSEWASVVNEELAVAVVEKPFALDTPRNAVTPALEPKRTVSSRASAYGSETRARRERCSPPVRAGDAVVRT